MKGRFVETRALEGFHVISSAANLDLYDLDLDLWQYSLDRKKII